jgi:CheY-like chemotaxis protein
MEDKKQYKIMIVDDDTLLLNLYKKKFEQEGHKVNTLASGEKALNLLRENYDPDIILLDIVMPFPDGLEILGTIRKENLAPKAAVIILSNEGNSNVIERAKSLQITGFIVKAALIPSEVVEEALKITSDWQLNKK